MKGKYTTYTARNYENSGPDYLGVNLGYSLTFWGTPGLSHAIDLNIGYVKNDGWVIFPTFKPSSGFDISFGGGITLGTYRGKGIPQASSLGGLGTYFSYTRGLINYGYSKGYDDNLVHNWSFYSVGAGRGVPKIWNTQFGVTITSNPHYLRDFDWSN